MSRARELERDDRPRPAGQRERRPVRERGRVERPPQPSRQSRQVRNRPQTRRRGALLGPRDHGRPRLHRFIRDDGRGPDPARLRHAPHAARLARPVVQAGKGHRENKCGGRAAVGRQLPVMGLRFQRHIGAGRRFGGLSLDRALPLEFVGNRAAALR